jgi:hypothetical protein
MLETPVPSQIDTAVLHQALEHDSEFAIQFLMSDYLDLPVPQIHIEVEDLMADTSIDKTAIVVPRGHAKTTLAKIAAWKHIQFSDYSYILYMSDTLTNSVAAVKDIADFFETPNYVATFGEVDFTVRQEGKGFYRLTLANGKRIILKAFSAHQSTRGTNINHNRPQLIIVDDLENPENIHTEELFKSLKRWTFGTFAKCVDPRKNKWIWIGNLISQQSILYEILNSKFWYSRLYGCLKENGKPLWPELWSLEALQQDYEQYLDHGMADIWFAEMMNMPVVSQNALIDASEITYMPELHPGDHKHGFLTVDFNSSNNEWSHKSAITVHIFNEHAQQWQIVDWEESSEGDPITLFPIILKFCMKWRIGIVALESVAYQATAQKVFEYLCLVHKVDNLKFLPVPSRANKTFRIATWCGALKKKMYVLTEKDFHITYQLLHYDPQAKENIDDTIDSCAMGMSTIQLYGYEIWSYVYEDPISQAAVSQGQTMYQISPI